jgi:hypothetical protein
MRKSGVRKEGMCWLYSQCCERVYKAGEVVHEDFVIILADSAGYFGVH